MKAHGTLHKQKCMIAAKPVVTGLLLVVAFALFILPTKDAQATYKLGIQDKLTIRVVEWQAVEGTLRDWTAIGGAYVVGPSGTISIPFIGELPATGKTTEDIALSISTSLQATFGLIDPPQASVEIAEYRPFYINGDVTSPGQYPYVPGLTALKALSIAGGMRREPGFGTRASRDLVNATGMLEILQDQRLRLLIRRARIEAHKSGKPDILIDPVTTGSTKADAIIADEKAIMTTRQSKLDGQIEALDDLRTLLKGEIVTLGKKIAALQRQLAIINADRENVGQLAKRGLAVNARVASLDRTIAETEAKIFDMETAVLRAKQDISKAVLTQTDLRNSMEAELATDRQTIDAQLSEVMRRITMQESLLSEAISLSPGAAVGLGGEDLKITFTLVRTIHGKPTQHMIDENTPLLPGDVIKVGLTAASNVLEQSGSNFRNTAKVKQ